MENLRPCLQCGQDFKPPKGNHQGLCSHLCQFFAKIEFAETGCWIWRAALSPAGYGAFRGVSAHRWAYEHVGAGTLIKGLELDHLCRVRACVNPDHVEQVTHAENMRRSVGLALRTHCNKGHEFTPENTYVTSAGIRYCLICKRSTGARASRAYYARKAQTNA